VWFTLLKDGGKVITTVRSGGDIKGIPRDPKSSEIDEFERSIKESIKFWKDFINISSEEIIEKGRTYALKSIYHIDVLDIFFCFYYLSVC
jgi:hypothetical protein